MERRVEMDKEDREGFWAFAAGVSLVWVLVISAIMLAGASVMLLFESTFFPEASPQYPGHTVDSWAVTDALRRFLTIYYALLAFGIPVVTTLSYVVWRIRNRTNDAV